jgi:hypothetical protein
MYTCEYEQLSHNNDKLLGTYPLIKDIKINDKGKRGNKKYFYIKIMLRED